MDREEVMFWKAMLPGAVWMVAGAAAMWVLSGLPGSPLTDGLFKTLRWGPVTMVGWGLLQLSAAGYRYWQWQRGGGSECQCGGVLGSAVLGRGSAYRRCLGCGKRHYE
jgi:hypothetical protein